MSDSLPKIYLAGPSVFRPDAKAYAASLKELCNDYGYEGLYPLDNEVTADTPSALAEEIRLANVALIQVCDIVIADLSPFRGPEPDSGTVWEIGYAMGIGKKVLAFDQSGQTHTQKTQLALGLDSSATHDSEGMEIENFGLTHNLMFAHCVVGKSFEEVLMYLKEDV